MGVKDLATVLLKHAPNSSTPHNSLASFRNKTLALDANLLTIKFHHRKPSPTWTQSLDPSSPALASAPPFPSAGDPHRHVKSWYKFITELQALGIKPIVVFDGSTRVPEKARENERRRAGRELQLSRGKAEGERSKRLRKVKVAWDEVQVGDRYEVATEFVRLVGEAKAGERAVANDEGDLATVASVSTNSTPTIPTPISPTSAPNSEPPILLFSIDLGKSGPAERLVDHYLDFQLDTSNPVYSKNQLVISSSESRFFSDLFNLGLLPSPSQGAARPDSTLESPAALAAEEPESSAVADAVAEADERVAERPPPVLDATHEESDDMDLGLSDTLKESERLGASHLSRGEGVPRKAFADSLALIQALGIPYLLPPPSSPTEAESLCSTLCALGKADFVVSEDTDVTVYGAPLLRQVGMSQYKVATKRGERQKGMNVLDPVKVREELGMTRAMFVDFCLLCGTDFTERLKGLGPMTALNLIKKHTSIEALLANHPAALTALADVNLTPSAYLQTVHAARALFLTPAPLPAGLPEDWDRMREPSEDLPELMALWGIDDGTGVPRRARGGVARVESSAPIVQQVLEEIEAEAADVEWDEDVGAPPEDGWDAGEVDRLAELAARL